MGRILYDDDRGRSPTQHNVASAPLYQFLNARRSRNGGVEDVDVVIARGEEILSGSRKISPIDVSVINPAISR
jgi:hypothetical protein